MIIGDTPVDYHRARADGTVLHFQTKCKRCGGSVLWVDFQGELQCMNCDPPSVVYAQKLAAQKKKKMDQAVQLAAMEAEDAVAEDRKAFEKKRK